MASREVFKRNLLEYMVKAGFSQIELAKAVGVSKSTVTTWLNGRSYPRIDVIQRMADVLCCTTDELVADNPEHLTHQKKSPTPEKVYPDIAILTRGWELLTQEQRDMIIRTVQAMFPQAFPDEPNLKEEPNE